MEAASETSLSVGNSMRIFIFFQILSVLFKKSIQVIGILILACSFLQIQAQELSETGTRQLRKYRKGALREKDHYTQIIILYELLKRKPEKIKWQFEKGRAHFVLRDYENARKLLTPLFNRHRANFPQTSIMLCYIHTYTGRTDSAMYFLEQTKQAGVDPAKDYPLKKWMKTHKSTLALQLNADTVWYGHRVKLLPGNINRPNIEFAPLSIGTDTLIFGSLPRDSSIMTTVTDTNQRRLYMALRKNQDWIVKGLWFEEINTPANLQLSSVCLSPDGKIALASFCRLNWKYESKCRLYYSDLQTEWKPLPRPINTRKYTQTQPWIAPGIKNKNTLYFVSDRPGGKGGKDIWYTQFKVDDMQFDEPRNAGSKINTPADECTPRYWPDMRKLFFSSEGHPGYGGLDVFYAIGDRGHWSIPINVGKPINSTFDDLYFTQNNVRSGFFTSNRTGVSAQFSPNCCDDIFEFTFDVKTTGKILMTFTDLETKQTLNQIKIKVFVIEPTEGEEIFIGEFSADRNGNFGREFEKGFKYKLMVSREKYHTEPYIIDLFTRLPPPDTLRDTVQLRKWTPEEIVIPNIYYAFDDARLSAEAGYSLDTSIVKLMLQNPQLQVEIGSHTDDKGSDTYNLKLSQKRAESVVRYLISKGIESNRLAARGFGKTHQIAPNCQPDGTDNPNGRAQNRRTTFRIVGESEIQD